MYDLIIVGGGPAGCAAAVYAARKLLKTALIAESFGGQSIVSADVENWIGTLHISGEKLAKDLEAHVREYASDTFTIVAGERVTTITKSGNQFTVTTNTGTVFETRAVLVATGGARRQLAVPGADLFEHKGLTYCASCDGPLFSGQDVAVIGGGNAGFETAAQLLAYAKSVTLLSRGEFRADPITVKTVTAHPNMVAIPMVEILEVTGEKFVNGLKYKDASGEHALAVGGIFVEIGLMPATAPLQGLVDLDPIGRVIVDPWTMKTSLAGVWAAGDCTNGLYHQNNIASGDAVRALEDIYVELKTK